MSTNYTYAHGERQEPGDREAPLKFHTEDVKIGKKRYESRVSTYERGEDQRTWTKIASEKTFERQHWNVGLAINHHSTTGNSMITSLGKATHWGVYICPIDTQNEVSYSEERRLFQKSLINNVLGISIPDIWLEL